AVLPDGAVIAGLDGERYRQAILVVEHDAMRPLTRPLARDELIGATPAVVRMESGGAAIRGRIVDSVTRKPLALYVDVRQEPGAPMPMGVEFGPYMQRTDDHGCFAARGLRPGPARVIVHIGAGPQA